MPSEVKDKLPATPWGDLPPRMRVLFIAGTERTAGWLAEALAADAATAVELHEVAGIAAGLAQLRGELFDAVLVSHEGEHLDALALLDAIRAGSCDEQPIIVLGAQTSCQTESKSARWIAKLTTQRWKEPAPTCCRRTRDCNDRPGHWPAKHSHPPRVLFAWPGSAAITGRYTPSVAEAQNLPHLLGVRFRLESSGVCRRTRGGVTATAPRYKESMDQPHDKPHLIPVLLGIDIEPDGFFIDRNDPAPFLGLENYASFIEPLRERIAQATGSVPRLTWRLRLDPQITETYGSPIWPLETYGHILDDLRSAGDELGVHVHAFRWSKRLDNWIADYGNQPWVEHCVGSAIEAFESALGQKCRAFSFGNHWLNQDSAELLESLGVESDMSVAQGLPAGMQYEHLDEFSGVRPDLSFLPRTIYRASADDFRVADPLRPRGLWMIPLTSQIPAVRLNVKRRFSAWKARLCGREPSILLALGHRRGLIDDSFDYHLRHLKTTHVAFDLRSSDFNRPEALSRIEANLAFILSHEMSGRFVFTTATDAVRLVTAKGESTASQVA